MQVRMQVIGTVGGQLTVQQQALLAAAFLIQGDNLHMYAHIAPCINSAAEPPAMAAACKITAANSTYRNRQQEVQFYVHERRG